MISAYFWFLYERVAPFFPRTEIISTKSWKDFGHFGHFAKVNHRRLQLEDARQKHVS